MNQQRGDREDAVYRIAVFREDDVNWEYVAWTVGLFGASFVVSLVAVTFVLISLPATFFLDSHVRDLWIDHHSIIRWAGRVLKTLGGIALIVLGLILSVPGVPGQGILTVLIGLILVDFPGKRRLERKLLARPRVRSVINRLRARFHKQPLLVEEPVLNLDRSRRKS